MRFLMMIKGDRNYEAGKPPDPKLMAAIGKFAQEMAPTGVYLQSEGLLPSSKGALVKASGGRLSVVDGPFPETKEVFGGLAIVQVKSKDEAIELCKRFMKIHQDVLGPTWEGESEVRQLMDVPATFERK
jgi:hypothetical protein